MPARPLPTFDFDTIGSAVTGQCNPSQLSRQRAAGFPARNASPYRLSASPHFIAQKGGGKVIGLLGRDFLKYFHTEV